MRHPAPTPSGSALPMPRARVAYRRHTAGTVPISSAAIEKFNALVHRLCLDAPQIDADAIASMARWLDSQPIEQRELLLQSRLDRLSELEAMRNDADWPMELAQAHRIESILDYVASEDDLIADAVPVHGHLDDALLLELAWPMLAEDVDDYRDFCCYRDEMAGNFKQSVHQLDWLRTRAEEGALWEHMHRVHEQDYVAHGAPATYFRVS